MGIKSSLCFHAEFMYKIKNNEASLLSTENKFLSYGIGSIYTAEESIFFPCLKRTTYSMPLNTSPLDWQIYIQVNKFQSSCALTFTFTLVTEQHSQLIESTLIPIEFASTTYGTSTIGTKPILLWDFLKK